MSQSTERTRVYVCGPYSKPDQCVNTNSAIKVADRLLAIGYAPYVPHLTHFWHTMSPKPYREWMDLDREFIRCYHALLRLPGDSSGSDEEVAWANELGVPVYYSVEELVKGTRNASDQD